jgi:hypothetical protein
MEAAASAAAVAAAPTKLAQHAAASLQGGKGGARGKGGRRGAGTLENPINAMKQWATHCEKELASHGA